ncbi:hypothetical protein F7725_023615 [Dissostichus mawsoni]|uniref:Kinesin motor domain-containing protein n=1 Tax=Dissostichus mawsoni TaxID=36200 RepID=A0A7J5XX09_DISMA|nr:hypothetical protein F7725_023615 [Dissostichus mawsoni]
MRRDLLSEFSTLPYPQDCVTIERPDTALLKPPNPPPSARLSSDKALPQTGQRFQFSQVYGPETSQKELFQGTVKDLVKDVLEGGNSLVFTYGVQMLMLAFCPAPWMLSSAASMSRCSTGRASNLSDAESSPDSPRSSRRRKPPSRDTSSDNLKRHLHDGYFRGEDQSGSGRTHKVLCLDFFLHSIFSIRILRIEDIGTMRVHAVSELCLCDLAGSERCAKTQNKGERLKEAGNINTSLLILGKCLNALRHNQQAKLLQHVPFRESKLTHYLQGFFCGRGKACMIVNINQCASMYDETLNVLKFSAVAQKKESARQPEELLIGWDSSLEDVQVVQLQVQLKKERAENLLMDAREERRGREEAITALEIQTTGREEALASLQKEIGVNKKLLESERRAKDKAAAELSEESKQRMEVVASLCRERRVRQEAEIRLEEERKEVRRLMEERETLQQEVREKTSRLETSEQQVGNTVTNVMVRTTETLEQNRKDLQQKTSQVLTLTQEVQSLKQEVQTSATSDDQLREEVSELRKNLAEEKENNEKEMLELEEDLGQAKEQKQQQSQQEAALKQQIEDLKKQFQEIEEMFQQPPEEAHELKTEKLEEHILASKELNEKLREQEVESQKHLDELKNQLSVQETTFCSTVKDLKLKLSEQLEGAKLTESDISFSSSSSSSSSSAAAAEEDLKRLNSVLQTEITSLKAKKQLEEKLAAVTKVSAEREADLEKQLQEKETDLEKQLEEKLAAVTKVSAEREADLEKQLEEKLAEMTKVSAKREADLEKQLEEKETDLEKQLEEKETDLEKQLEEKLAAVTKVSAEREADLEKQLEEKLAEMTKVSAEMVKQLEEKLAEMTKVSAEREADLEKQLKETDLEKQLEEKLAEMTKVSAEREADLEKQLEEKETDLVKQLEEKLAEMTKVSAEREADLEKQLEEKETDLVKQLEEKLAEMTKVSAEREADLEKQLQEKEAKMASLKERREEEEIQTLQENRLKEVERRRELMADSDKVKSLSVDLRRKEDDASDLKEKLSDCKKQIQQVQKEISSMREEEKLSKQKLTDIEKSKRQLQSDIASRDRTIQTLRVRVMEDMRLALTEQEETQEQMETVLEEKLNVIQELSSGMLLQQDRRGNNAHDQSTGQSDDLKQAKQEVAQSQERFKESLSSQLAEKEQLMEKWRKERDTLVSALEVQLQKLLSSQSADGEGVMAELQAALSERDSEILRLKEELEAANTKQEETQTKTTESESPATLVGKPQSEGIKRKSGGRRDKRLSVSSQISTENGRMSRFPRPEMEISFSSLQPNRMALRRQGEENSVTVKITRRSKRRTTRKEEVEVENTRSKATPKLTAHKEEFTSQFFCRNTTRDTQGQTSEFLPESFSQQSSEVWESNDGLEENPETKEEQKETVQT